MDKIEQQIKDTIERLLQVDAKKITPQANFAQDLGADSLDLVELIMAFEDEFSIEIPDEDADKIMTVKQAVDYIKSKI